MSARIRFPTLPGAPVMPATSGVTWTHSARGGPLDASWSQVGTTSLPITAGTWVEIWDDGEVVWWGSIGEQSDRTAGKWHAVGPVKDADRWPALSGASSLAPTSSWDIALEAMSVAPGSPVVGFAAQPGTPGLSGFGSLATPDQVPLVTQLVDDAMGGGNLDGHQMRWWITKNRRLTWELRSAIPVSAHVRLSDGRMGTTRDGNPTHVHISYRLPGSGATQAWTTVESTAPGEWADTARWAAPVDLTGKGGRLPAAAQAAGARQLGRPALTEPMILGVHNTTTPGQVPMPGRMLRAGMKVRVWLTDSMDSVGSWVDVILDETKHTDATSSIEAVAEGTPARGARFLARSIRHAIATPWRP